MKRWRVGTLSMGLSLIMAGMALFGSTWNGWSAFDALIRWWPVIFILLGLELLLFVALSRGERPVVYYDVFSILFVGVLLIACLGYALAASTGLAAEIRYAIGSEERTVEWPALEQPLPAGVDRIVVQVAGTLPRIDTVATHEVHIFGSYRAQFFDGKEQTPMTGDAATLRTVGNTLYISLKQPPERNGWNRSYSYPSITVALPNDVPIELRGANNQPIEWQNG